MFFNYGFQSMDGKVVGDVKIRLSYAGTKDIDMVKSNDTE
jgi:hypothetical protein